MCLKAKVIIGVLQVERVAENSGQPKLVVLNFGFGQEAVNSSPRSTNVLKCYTGSRIWKGEIHSYFRAGNMKD